MTPEEWKFVKEAAADTLTQPADSRDAYLRNRCPNPRLQREIESLIDSISKAAELFETPALATVDAESTAEVLAEIGPTHIGELVGPYRIVKQIGTGGMGSAFLAVRADDAYEKVVAIKLIKRGMSTPELLRRFRQERQVLANLDHPNIARLLDGGTTQDGLPYFVMEYIDGLPVDAYCDKHRLTIDSRLRLFLDICAAVQHAHDNHVIHRDLKPTNILVTAGGVVKLLDFGISKVLTPDDATARSEHTLLYAMTPRYSSPEQLLGQSATQATDVYSLGVLLFELLTGHWPYVPKGKSLLDVSESIRQDDPEKPSQAIGRVVERGTDATRRVSTPEPVSDARGVGLDVLKRHLTGDLDNIVLKALRKEPARRYASPTEFARDVRRHLDGDPVSVRADDLGYRAGKFVARHRMRAIEVAILATVIVILALAAMPSRRTTPAANVIRGSVAILPFVNAAGNSDVEYLEDGLMDSLIERLSGLPQLRVLPRSSVYPFKGSTADPQTIGKKLNVSTVLLGKIREVSHRLQLTVDVIGAQDGKRLWGSEYVATPSELADVKERIASDVVGHFRLDFATGDQQRFANRETENGEAYQFYLRGRYVWNKRTEEGFRQGLKYFQQAIDIDPEYALAYTGLADCYNLLGVWGAMPPNQAMPKVRESVLKAIEIDDSLAEAHTSLAFVNWVYDWNWAKAEQEFKRALSLNPNYATAHDWYAYYLASAGRFPEAIVEIRRAQALEPVSLSVNTDVGEIYYWAREYDVAIDQLRSVLQIERDFPMARNILGLTLLKKGRTQEGITELEEANRLSTGPRMLSTLGYAYGLSGARSHTSHTLDEVSKLSRTRYTSAFATALIHAGAGDKDRAFQKLEEAFKERSDSMVILRVYPPLDELRQDPRFADLLQRVGP